MEPDVLNVPVERLLRNFARNRGMGGNHDCVDMLRDGCQRGIAGSTFYLGGVGVHCEDFVSRFGKASVDGVCGRVAGSRNSRDSDSLAGEEVRNWTWHLRHAMTSNYAGNDR